MRDGRKRGVESAFGDIKFIRSQSLFYRRGWEPADGVDKPENFSSIAGSFNIATAGSYLKDRKMDVKRFQVFNIH